MNSTETREALAALIARVETMLYVGCSAAGEPLQKRTTIINDHLVQVRIHGNNRYAWVDDSDEKIPFERLVGMLG